MPVHATLGIVPTSFSFSLGFFFSAFGACFQKDWQFQIATIKICLRMTP